MCQDNRILDRDPGFIDEPAMNFRLKEDSRVLDRIKDVQHIPFEKIGLQHKP